MAPFAPVSHVIFDMDGVILDTEPVYVRRFEELCRRYGKTFTQEMRLAVQGRQDEDCAKAIISEANLPLTPQQFIHEAKQLQLDGMRNCSLMPGLERLVVHFYIMGVPIAIATSSGQESTDLKFTKHKDLMRMFSHVVAGGSDPEVKNGKPSPDIFLTCASRFKDKPEPSKCLVIEDAHFGVQAAKAAGMQVVMLPGPFMPPELTKDATLTIKSLKDFQPELFGLPAYPNKTLAYPSKCLVIEDAHFGVQAAKAAGMQVVMLPGPFMPPELTKDATLTIKSLKDFQPELFGLPPYHNKPLAYPSNH